MGDGTGSGKWDDGVYCVRVLAVRDRKRGKERTRYRVQGYYHGHRKDTEACAKFASEDDAVEAARLLWQDYINGLHDAPKKAPVTVQDLIDRFCEREVSKRGKLLSKSTTQRSYPTQLRSLVRVTGADWPLTHLGKRHVEAVLRLQNEKTGKALSRATTESYLRSITAMVKWAVKEGHLSKDITEGVVFDRGPSEMRPWLQPGEVDAFLDACRPSHKIRAGLIIETGMRVSEAAHLRWAWIQHGIGRPSIRIPAIDSTTGFTTKGKQARAIPLSARAQAFLEEAKEAWGKDGFILHANAEPIRPDNWNRETHRACRKAEVTDCDTHGLRRTAGALWLCAGLDIYRVSRLLGHQSVTTTERAYAGLADGHLAAAMDLVDDRGALPQIGASGLKMPSESKPVILQRKAGGLKIVRKVRG